MAYDDISASGWARFLRAIQASFRLGSAFGVEVRVYWLTLILLPLIGLLEIGPWASSALETIVHTATMTLLLYVVVWSHEMSHILAARAWGIHTPLITLSPLGGVAHLGSPPVSPRADILISLAGPAVHLVWLAVAWPLSSLVEPGWGRPSTWSLGPLFFAVDLLFTLNLWLMIFNLLPFLPLDGGRVLRAVLTRRMHANRATILAARIGMVGAVGFVVFGIVQGHTWGGILIAIGISNFLACRGEIRMARWSAGPYADAAPRDPWEMDPEAWKGARSAPPREPSSGGGPFRRWRAGREARAARRRAEERARLDEEVDRVLARVSEVGMAGLKRHERSVLQRAAKARRQG